jgi:lysylphosphatidylglycerol synthetase-like protein (DUF2156 family)
MSDPTSPAEAMPQESPPAVTSRPQLVGLQTLVMLVLSYQLLFTPAGLLAIEVQQVGISALMLVTAGLVFLPASLWANTWVVGSVILFDTAVTTYVLHLSGNAGSDLYFIYFLLLLIAAFTATLTQMVIITVVLCGAYAMSLYLLSQHTGSLMEGHLLRIPVLLILATFYGVIAETARKERRRPVGAAETLERLKQLEEERGKLIRTLQDTLAHNRRLEEEIARLRSPQKDR